MTREEAKTFMRKLWRETMTGTYAEEAIDMAIKALEQPEPCEDAVSRKAAVDALHQHFADGFEEDRWWNSTHVLATLKSLPSVTPERKTGHWIRHPEQKNIYGGKCVECSECGEKYMVQYIEDEKFCRNCGADMRGEDK